MQIFSLDLLTRMEELKGKMRDRVITGFGIGGLKSRGLISSYRFSASDRRHRVGTCMVYAKSYPDDIDFCHGTSNNKSNDIFDKSPTNNTKEKKTKSVRHANPSTSLYCESITPRKTQYLITVLPARCDFYSAMYYSLSISFVCKHGRFLSCLSRASCH